MKVNQSSEFDKYIIMCDKGQSKLTSDYLSYLKFKEVQDALVKISQTPGQNYMFAGEVYEKGMTCSQADRVLDDIFNCKTSMEMMGLIVKVARQIGFHEITPPRKTRWRQ
jgi:hypothetical protein